MGQIFQCNQICQNFATLWQTFKSLWPFLGLFYNLWAVFGQFFIWQVFLIVRSGQILKKLSSHLVTLKPLSKAFYYFCRPLVGASKEPAKDRKRFIVVRWIVFLKWASPSLFYIVYFWSFQTNIITIFIANMCMSIQYTVQGFEHSTFGTWVSSHNH